MLIALIKTLSERVRIRAGPLTRAGPGPPMFLAGVLEEVRTAVIPQNIFNFNNIQENI
jgi:hypothetical protein